jgi:hypothetical protein
VRAVQRDHARLRRRHRHRERQVRATLHSDMRIAASEFRHEVKQLYSARATGFAEQRMTK